NTRSVELTGEGYFEVAHDQQKPFIVTSQNQQTIVKGTKFNITAYSEDRKMTTTLLEGSVLVKAVHDDRTDEVLLRPNEQVVLENNVIAKSSVHAMQAIAWKNGKFIFNKHPLRDFKQQLTSMYVMKILYHDTV